MSNRFNQVVLENKYSRKHIRSRVLADIVTHGLADKFDKATALVSTYLHGEYYKSKDIRVKAIRHMSTSELVEETLVAVLTSKDAQPIQAVASRLAARLPFDDIFDGIKTASELIAVICRADFYDVIAANSSDTGSLMVRSNVALEPCTLKAIAGTKYLPPMVCEPNELKSTGNMDNTHITYKDSLILGSPNHHELPLAIDALNIANQVKLALDEDILMFEEIPNKPLDSNKKQLQFDKMAADSLEVYNELLELGNEFYLTWKPDSRGRIYSQGYHVNIQSTGYKKALINLAHKETITL